MLTAAPPAPRQPTRIRPRRAVARAVVRVLALLAVGLLPLGPAGRAAVLSPPPPAPPMLYLFSDYITAPPAGRRALRLDPVTLGEHAAGPDRPLEGLVDTSPFAYGFNSGSGGGLLAADARAWLGGAAGSDRGLVPADWPPLVIRDGPDGPVRRRLPSPVAAGALLLSRDGQRLVVAPLRPAGGGARTDWSAWWVLDVATGRLTAAVRADPVVGLVQRAWLDPAGRRLYRLERADGDFGPPLVLVGLDLLTGAEVGRLALPAAGVAALAPDGRQLAIVHQAAPALTLIDLDALAVARTLALTRPPGLPAPGPPAPRPPDRNGGWSSVVGAAFAPDGRRLYVYDALPAPGDEPAAWLAGDAGISLVDLAEGRVVAAWPADAPIRWLQPTPDGRALLVYGPRPGGPDDVRPPYRLRRLTAGTFAVEAERDVEGPWQVLLWPVGSWP